MQLSTPIGFTANGLVGHGAFTADITSPQTGKKFEPAYLGNSTAGSVDTPAQGQRVTGFAYTGFTKVVAYNGVDNTGDVVFVGAGPGTYPLTASVNCYKGLYVEVTGSGKGTVWVA